MLPHSTTYTVVSFHQGWVHTSKWEFLHVDHQIGQGICPHGDGAGPHKTISVVLPAPKHAYQSGRHACKSIFLPPYLYAGLMPTCPRAPVCTPPYPLPFRAECLGFTPAFAKSFWYWGGQRIRRLKLSAPVPPVPYHPSSPDSCLQGYCHICRGI